MASKGEDFKASQRLTRTAGLVQALHSYLRQQALLQSTHCGLGAATERAALGTDTALRSYRVAFSTVLTYCYRACAHSVNVISSRKHACYTTERNCYWRNCYIALLWSHPRSELASPIALIVPLLHSMTGNWSLIRIAYSATATEHGWQLVSAIEWNGQHRCRFAKCASVALQNACISD